ncbi:hypothetical protein BHM03_00025766, partial [Ensete ventricosum]
DYPRSLGRSRPPLQGGWPWPGCGRSPLQGVWPWSAALIEGLAMAGCPLSLLLSLRKCSKNA